MTSEIETRFKKAAYVAAHNPKPKPQPAETKLKVYGLFKQATEGDVQGERPGMLNVKGRYKFDAWSQFKGLSKEEAMKQYLEIFDGVDSEWETSIGAPLLKDFTPDWKPQLPNGED